VILYNIINIDLLMLLLLIDRIIMF